MCYHHDDLHQVVKRKKPWENRKAKVLWAMKEAEDSGEEYYDPIHSEW